MPARSIARPIRPSRPGSPAESPPTREPRAPALTPLATDMLADIIPIVPVLIVMLSACAVLLAEAFRRPGERMPVGVARRHRPRRRHRHVGVAVGPRTPSASASSSSTTTRVFFNVTICAIGLLTILLSSGHGRARSAADGRVLRAHAVLAVGMMLMGATRDLLVIFLALEIMSLGVYVLTGIKRTSEQGAEAAFKYFVLGAFSSAFFLYGIALAYAVTGTTKLDELGVRVAELGARPGHPA